jgi:hypothetical protein
MLEEAILQYKDIFVKAKSDFDKVVSVSMIESDNLSVND